MRARSVRRRVVMGVGVAALLAGCSDRTVVPAAPRPPALLSVDVETTVFTYDPNVAHSITLSGGHRISLPALAVCDPGLSTYGVGEWDKPCAPMTQPVTITAKSVVDDRGHPYVDLQPALRFVPGTHVELYLKDEAASQDSTAVIRSCGPDGSCVEEPALQHAYQTKRDAGRGVVFRSIKHSSGYLVATSRSAAASF